MQRQKRRSGRGNGNEPYMEVASMKKKYKINGQTWYVEASSFEGCVDLMCGTEIITILDSATDKEIIDLLEAQPVRWKWTKD